MTVTAAPFTPARADGRSDRRVVYELVEDAEPGVTFGYEQLIAELSDGLEVPVSRDRVYRAVGAANATLLRERKRYLSVVTDVGYRVIAAEEHLPVALIKKDRAQQYLRRGIDLLRNVRSDELNNTQRTLHEGQLLILGGLYQAVRESARRHDRTEALISELKRSNDQITERLDRLESGEPT